VESLYLWARFQMPKIEHESAIFFANQFRSPRLKVLAGAEKFDEITSRGTIIVGALNLGGLIETIPGAIRIAYLGTYKQAQSF